MSEIADNNMSPQPKKYLKREKLYKQENKNGTFPKLKNIEKIIGNKTENINSEEREGEQIQRQ